MEIGKHLFRCTKQTFLLETMVLIDVYLIFELTEMAWYWVQSDWWDSPVIPHCKPMFLTLKG